MDELGGKVAVITGAGRGIGRLAALRLAGRGVRVALVSRSAGQLAATLEEIAAKGGEAIAIPADVGSSQSVAAMKAEVESRLGAPSILVNAAGVFGPVQLVWKTDPAAWIETVMVNTVAPYLLCRAFAEGMIRLGWGRIVNVTSAAALHEPGPINSAYGTSKAALNQFTRHLAAELAGSGVTANVIHPGDVKTEMWADIREKARGLGPEAARYQEWADWVETTGGDDPEKASDLIEALVGERGAAINGRFLWIATGCRRRSRAGVISGRPKPGESSRRQAAQGGCAGARRAGAGGQRRGRAAGGRTVSSTSSAPDAACGRPAALGARAHRHLRDQPPQPARGPARAVDLGVVDSRHGGGAFVTDLEARTLLAPLDFFLSLSETNLADAFESPPHRRDRHRAAGAAAEATPEDVDELRGMLAAHAKLFADPVGFRILDSRFHARLSATAGNVVLERLAYALYNMGLDIRRRATEDPALIRRSLEEHTAIVRAIAAGDPERRLLAMAAHLAPHRGQHPRRHRRRTSPPSYPAREETRGGRPEAGVLTCRPDAR